MDSRIRCVVAVVPLVLGSASSLYGEAPARRWAFLVGVDDYAVLKDLEYAAADQRALAGQLAGAGFASDQIVLLEDQATQHKYHPGRANILRELNLFLKLPNRGDVVLVGFSGHGVSLGGKSYLCPAEASLEDPAGTMIPIDEVFEGLKTCTAAFKLMLVDACRNDPRLDGQRSATPIRAVNDFARSLERPPEGLLLLTSCGHDQVAWEEREFGHGVFMHFMLDGLQGKAADDDGSVRLMRLYDYASDQTKKYVARKFSAYQSPGFEGHVDGVFELARIDRAAPPELPRTPPAERPEIPARAVGPGEMITNSIGMKLVPIPAGEFQMGSPAGEKGRDADERQHRVRITRPFYLGQYEVTLGQFLKFYHAAGYKCECERDGEGSWGFDSKGSYGHQRSYVPWSWGHTGQTMNHPVVNVTWNDAEAFCRWLSQQEGRTYRLPTEAEWEYSCRAGTTTRFNNGDVLSEDYAILLYTQRTVAVGHFGPNGFGLYDMHGNVREWCGDWYDKEYYAASPSDDPAGPSGGSDRVIRGGGGNGTQRFCRSAYRYGDSPSTRFPGLGFRVACSPR